MKSLAILGAMRARRVGSGGGGHGEDGDEGGGILLDHNGWKMGIDEVAMKIQQAIWIKKFL